MTEHTLAVADNRGTRIVKVLARPSSPGAVLHIFIHVSISYAACLRISCLLHSVGISTPERRGRRIIWRGKKRVGLDRYERVNPLLPPSDEMHSLIDLGTGESCLGQVIMFILSRRHGDQRKLLKF